MFYSSNDEEPDKRELKNIVARNNLKYLNKKKRKNLQIRRPRIEYLNLNKLNHDYRLLIKKLYENLLEIQSKNLNLGKREIQIIQRELSSQSTSSNKSSSLNSLLGYTDNFKLSQQSNQSSLFLQELDRFSSILFDQKEMKNPNLSKNIDELKIRNDRINQEYKTKIEPIQKEIMPDWNKIESNEKLGLTDLYIRWETAVSNCFNQIKLKQKHMKSLSLNESKLIEKGAFNFRANEISLKKYQLDLFESSNKQDLKLKMKPHTRLILKCFKEVLAAFDSIEMARKLQLDSQDLKGYWSNLSVFLAQMSKSILRCAFYVHENANLLKASVGLPPIYVLETDGFQMHIKLETLYEYVFICLNQLKISVKKEQKDLKIKQREKVVLNANPKLKYNKLILNCLVRVIQACYLIRDSLIMKQIRFDKDSMVQNQAIVDVDIYAHYISNEFKLIREYLKQIIDGNFV